MKKNIFSLLSCAVAALVMSACSLDRTPDDPNVNMEFDQDAVFSKVYSTLAMPGQTGPSGDSDIDGFDGGTSAFYRLIWELNEFPTDEGWWIWGDPGVKEVRSMGWDASNDLVEALYNRLFINVTIANHFLDRTAEYDDAKTLTQRAEVRFIRAIYYYYLLDMFGQVPFSEHVSAEAPTTKTRVELFNWLETELLDVEKALPEKRLSLYRVDKTTAQLLLARLYLNAQVYTGKAYWNEAAKYAAEVMKSGTIYNSETDNTASGGFKYSAYQKLFMGDNNNNGAENEAVLMIYQDGNYCQAYGGARFVVCAVRDANWMPCGSTDSWSCFRTSPEIIGAFVDLTTAATLQDHEYNMPALIGDDRAIFCSYYRYAEGTHKEWDPTTKDSIDVPNAHTWDLKGNGESEMYDCWAGCKWTGVHSTANKPADYEGQDPAWPDTDIPFMRTAEAYLTYAEAVYRGGNAVNGSAEAAIQTLRDRAHNTQPFTINDDFLLDEWAREFWFEGRRRIDLIRFGQFAGEGVTRNWEGRGNKKSGEAPKAMDKKYNIYPLPESDVTANPNLAGINEANGY